MRPEQAALLRKAADSIRAGRLLQEAGLCDFAKPGVIPADFHRYLIEGQDSRNVGDYDTGPGLTAAQAQEQIARAERFLDLAHQRLDLPGSQAHPLRALPGFAEIAAEETRGPRARGRDARDHRRNGKLHVGHTPSGALHRLQV